MLAISDVSEIKSLSGDRMSLCVGHCSTSKHPNPYRLYDAKYDNLRQLNNPQVYAVHSAFI